MNPVKTIFRVLRNGECIMHRPSSKLTEAAPDLLDALKDLCAYCDGEIAGMSVDSNTCPMVMRIAMDAIAKAEGRKI